MKRVFLALAGLAILAAAGFGYAASRIDANYRTDIFGGLTFTFAMVHEGRRALSAAIYNALGGKQLMLPAHTTFDLGVRQAFTIRRTPVSFRFTVGNIFDKKSWKVLAGNTMQRDEARRYNLFFYADF